MKMSTPSEREEYKWEERINLAIFWIGWNVNLLMQVYNES